MAYNSAIGKSGRRSTKTKRLPLAKIFDCPT